MIMKTTFFIHTPLGFFNRYINPLRFVNFYFIGSFLNFLGTALTNSTNAASVRDTNWTNQTIADDVNQTNREIADSTNAINKEIAGNNLQFQRENLDYQKALQERIFQREDSSYQRTKNDMRQAGLSPLMMNGTNGAGEAIATGALHNDYQAQTGAPAVTGAPMQAYIQSKSALGELGSIVDEVVGLKQSFNEIESQELANQKAKLENAYLSSSYNNMLTKQKYELSLLDDEVNVSSRTKYSRVIRDHAETVLKQIEQLDAYDRREYEKHFGIVDGMSETEKRTAIEHALSGSPATSERGSPYWFHMAGDPFVANYFAVSSVFDDILGSKAVASDVNTAVDAVLDKVPFLRKEKDKQTITEEEHIDSKGRRSTSRRRTYEK